MDQETSTFQDWLLGITAAVIILLALWWGF